MKIAFYAPLKSPRHHRPSGDRLVARLFEQAIASGGFDIELASEFRSWEGQGDRQLQQKMQEEAGRIAEKLAMSYAGKSHRPSLWFTYHVYHKAPDWIGPLVASRLEIPYVVAEASYAPKQHNGPWRDGHEQCRRSIQSADAVISLNRQDDPCLRELLKPSCELIELKPFIPLHEFEPDRSRRQSIALKWNIRSDRPWLICVAMMRKGDKLSSYRELAQSLTSLLDEDWQLIVVGDGPARSDVEGMFDPIASRTIYTGLLDREEIAALFGSCDLYVWPAVNEAYGMALLEAHTCGLAVVSSVTGGVPQIVEHGQTGLLAPPGDIRLLGSHVRRLIREPELRSQMGARARAKCLREHDIDHASTVLARLFRRLTPPGEP